MFELLKENNLDYISSYLGKIDVFDCDGYDVLIVKMIDFGKEFLCANNLIKDNIDCKITHPNYTPHMTLCYARKGMVDRFKGIQPFENMILQGNVMFSNKKGDKK